jgi:AraC-like DNA-binding protein
MPPSLTRARDQWLSKVHSNAHFHTLFDHLPGVCFYCKDADGRFMLVSRGFLQHHQLRHEREILGLTDFDVAPHHMASGYVRDDARLLSGKARCVERVELWFDQQGIPDWFFVSSPQEFLMKTRVIAALKLLEETNLSAAEIAVRSGFVDGSSFAEQFRQRVGQSPTAYRQAMRADA